MKHNLDPFMGVSTSGIALTITVAVVERCIVLPSPSRISGAGSYASAITHTTQGLPAPEPSRIAGEVDVITAIEEEEAAKLFNLALANTESDEEWNGLAYALASQEVLARDWLTPEDDIDWGAQIIRDEE